MIAGAFSIRLRLAPSSNDLAELQQTLSKLLMRDEARRIAAEYGKREAALEIEFVVHTS
jgi:hypothetical protein